MKTKIVYVVVSDEADIYLEQAYISMFSVKYHNPDSHIILLTDNYTRDTFVGIRKEETKYADEIIVVDFSETKYDKQKRSRLLKTCVRNKVDGDFLFVDCDTIIVKPIDEIDNYAYPIAACRDSHSDFQKNPYRKICLMHGKKLGWPIEKEQEYFNSGVILVKDCLETHRFYDRWNENLLKGHKKNITMDQPSFAKTNYEAGHPISVLPDVWNCELKHGMKYLRDAKIVHYLCTNPSRYQNQQLFLLNERDVFDEIKKTGIISNQIKEIIIDPFSGLAETTHCFAGEDLLFFRTMRYNYFRSHFRPCKKSVIEYVLYLLFILDKCWNRVKLPF